MAEKVGKEQIKREKGYLYYLGKDGYLWKTPTLLNRSGRKARVGHEKITRQDGYMYFIDKGGFISRAKMREYPAEPPERVCDPGPYDIDVGNFVEILLEVARGDQIMGRLFEIEGQDFDWAIVDERNSVRFHEREEYSYARGEDHITATRVSWKVAKDGPWFLVLEIPYRQNPRSVRVELVRAKGA